MFYVRQLILLTLDRYHSSVSCIFELAMFSYWTLMSLRAAVRSGLDTSRSTWTCWAMICSCNSRSSCKEEVQIWLWLVAIIGALIFLLRDFYSFSILTSSWIFFKKFISSCSASIFLSSWTRFKDASSTSYARNEAHREMKLDSQSYRMSKLFSWWFQGTELPVWSHLDYFLHPVGARFHLAV